MNHNDPNPQIREKNAGTLGFGSSDMDQKASAPIATIILNSMTGCIPTL